MMKTFFVCVGLSLLVVMLVLVGNAYFYGSQALAKTEDNLKASVTTLIKTKKYKSALELAGQNVELAKKKYGDQHIEYAYALRLLAKAHIALGEFKKAAALIEKADNIGRRAMLGAPKKAKPFFRKRGGKKKIKPPYKIQKVFYATDRNEISSDKWQSAFGGERSKDSVIRYGLCEVSIPKNHNTGIVERPTISKLQWSEDPKEHVVLLAIKPSQKDAYFADIKKRIAEAGGNNAFIFIHGYNVDFEEAARRTAQMAHDLQFDGAPVFYSWPSKGKLFSYLADRNSSEWTQSNIKNFLSDFVARTEAENIYLIAHSMGGRALTGAVEKLILEQPELKERFKEIILAAPDIDADIFKNNIAPKMKQAAKNVTLYVSDDDNAMLVSQYMNEMPRAGEAGENILIIKDIDTIDATGVDASLIAHTYIATKTIINDLLSIIRHGKRAAGRKTLRPKIITRGTYWSFVKAQVE